MLSLILLMIIMMLVLKINYYRIQRKKAKTHEEIMSSDLGTVSR